MNNGVTLIKCFSFVNFDKTNRVPNIDKPSTVFSPIQEEYAEVGDDEYQLQQQDDIGENNAAAAPAAPATTTSTTEPPKKVGPIIRPFRSNDDLLSALKRRQQNTKTIKKVAPQTKSQDATDAEEQDHVVAAPVAPQRPKATQEKGKFFLLQK